MDFMTRWLCGTGPFGCSLVVTTMVFAVICAGVVVVCIVAEVWEEAQRERVRAEEELARTIGDTGFPVVKGKTT